MSHSKKCRSPDPYWLPIGASSGAHPSRTCSETHWLPTTPLSSSYDDGFEVERTTHTQFEWQGASASDSVERLSQSRPNLRQLIDVTRLRNANELLAENQNDWLDDAEATMMLRNGQTVAALNSVPENRPTVAKRMIKKNAVRSSSGGGTAKTRLVNFARSIADGRLSSSLPRSSPDPNVPPASQSDTPQSHDIVNASQDRGDVHLNALERKIEEMRTRSRWIEATCRDPRSISSDRNHVLQPAQRRSQLHDVREASYKIKPDHENGWRKTRWESSPCDASVRISILGSDPLCDLATGWFLSETQTMYECYVSDEGEEDKWAPFTLEQSLAIGYAKKLGEAHVYWIATRVQDDKSKPTYGQKFTKHYIVNVVRMVQIDGMDLSERPIRASRHTWDEIAALELEAVHVTKEEHVASILENGLDPNFGGKGGAGATVGIEAFVKHSTGKVHMTAVHVLNSLGEEDHTDGSEFYYNFYKQMGCTPVRLYVYAVGQDFEHDPDDQAEGRMRTHEWVTPTEILAKRYCSYPSDDPKRIALQAKLRQLKNNISKKIKVQVLKGDVYFGDPRGNRMGADNDKL